MVMAHSSLIAHMAACGSVMTCGVNSTLSRVFLVCKKDDVAAAVAFLHSACAGVRIVGAHIPDMEHSPENDGTLHMAIGAYTIPLLPLESVRVFPEAGVLLYSPAYCSSPVQKTDGFLLAQALARLVAGFSLAPAPNSAAWYARRYPDLYATQRRELDDVYALLADEASRHAFACVLKALLSGELGYLCPASFAQYAHPVVCVRPGDYVIDGGMHSLAETIHFAECAGVSGAVFGFEPEPSLFQKIQRDLEALPTHLSIRAFQRGLGACVSECHIVYHDAASWLTGKAQDNASPCMIQDIDSFMQEHDIPKLDVIKFDIEGCELDGLRGAENTIKRHKPRLMISAYHKYEDLFAIPQLIREFVPDYRIYFASHYMLTGEFLFYALVSE